MATRHRKLFPTNQTSADCSGFCDPACPYNCYTYTDYYFLSPPPPPPPSLIPQEHQISPYVIIVIALLATIFLLVSYYVIAGKTCAGWCGLRPNRLQPQQAEEDNNAGQEFLDGNRVDHPIWFITTIGLQQSIINSISVCKYKKGEGLIEGTMCSVCLSEFQQDETLRLLPKCNHAFHISCIDTWLRSHTNCPLCRAHIIVSDSAGTPLVPVNQNSRNLNSDSSSTRLENNSESDGVMGNFQERNELGDHDNTDGAAEVDGTLQQGNESERVLKENADSNQSGDLQVLPNDPVGNDPIKAYDMKPTRRSSSMDSLTAATMCLGLDIQSPAESQGILVNLTENAENITSAIILNGNGGDRSSYKPLGCSSISQCLHKSPIPMKRSFSCGGRFFSTRQNRNLNSILPL